MRFSRTIAVLIAITGFSLSFWSLRSGPEAPSPEPQRPSEKDKPKERFGLTPRRSVLFENVLDTPRLPTPKAKDEGRLVVRVNSLGRGPLGGVRVELQTGGGPARSAKTTADGTVVFDELFPGPWTVLSVQAEGHLASRLHELILGDGETRTVAVTLAPLRPIRGYVLRFDGRPLAGATVIVTQPDGETGEHTTQKRGLFRSLVVRGTRVEARHVEHGRARGIVDERILAGGRMALRLSPADASQAPATIAGVVEDSGPESEVQIFAQPQRGVAFSAVAENNGSFVVAVPAGATFNVVAEAEDGRRARAENVPSGTTGLTLKLEAGSVLVVEVLDSDGQVVPAFTLRWAREERGLAQSPRQRSVLNTEGRYQIQNLVPGAYSVEADAGPKGAGSTRGVNVPASGRGWASIRLSAPGAIRGRVLDEDTTQPILKATVRLESRPGLGRPPVTTSDDSGRFLLEGVAPGRRSVAASAPDHRTRIVSAIDVPVGGTVGPVEIRLAPRGEDDSRLDLVGIGAVMRVEEGAMVIQQVVPGGGAAEAGLKPGTRITAVNGRSVEEMGFDGAIQAIRGKVGTTVQLTVEKEGERVRVMTILRRRVST